MNGGVVVFVALAAGVAVHSGLWALAPGVMRRGEHIVACACSVVLVVGAVLTSVAR